MTPEYRRKAVGAALLTLSLGLVAVAVTDLKHGILSAGLILIALIVSDNL